MVGLRRGLLPRHPRHHRHGRLDRRSASHCQDGSSVTQGFNGVTDGSGGSVVSWCTCRCMNSEPPLSNSDSCFFPPPPQPPTPLFSFNCTWATYKSLLLLNLTPEGEVFLFLPLPTFLFPIYTTLVSPLGKPALTWKVHMSHLHGVDRLVSLLFSCMYEGLIQDDGGKIKRRTCEYMFRLNLS